MPTAQDEESFHAMMEFFVDAFPGGRIIFNTRDGAQVAQSGWWGRDHDPKKVRDLVSQSDARFRESKERLGDKAFLIDYAEYNGNPEGFAPLFNWLGETLPLERLSAISAQKLNHDKSSANDQRVPSGPLAKARRAVRQRLRRLKERFAPR